MELPKKQMKMTILDTPGHVDFSAEMERTLQVLDYAILVISGADGVQGHTRTLWNLLKRYRIPVFLFINKMDQNGTDRAARLEELKQKLDDGCIAFDGAEMILFILAQETFTSLFSADVPDLSELCLARECPLTTP